MAGRIFVLAFLIVSLAGFVGIAILTNSAFTLVKKRFFCPVKKRNVEVEFVPGFAGLVGKSNGDAYSCTAFENKYHITCERQCEKSELVERIPGVIEAPG